MSACPTTTTKFLRLFSRKTTAHSWGKWIVCGTVRDFFGVHPLHKRICAVCGATEFQEGTP